MTQIKTTNPKNSKLEILKWIISSSLLLGSIHLFTNILIVSIMYLILALFICPMTYKLLIEEKANINLSSKMKWFIVILYLFIITITQYNIEDNRNINKADNIIKTANNLIDDNKISESLKIINDAKKLYSSDSNKATVLENEINNYNNINFVEKTLVNMNDEDYKTLKSTKNINVVYLTQKTLNQKFIKLLYTKIKLRKNLLIQAKEAEEATKEAEAYQLKRSIIEKHFFSYDGSHMNLERYIKKNMNDPNSYEHVETTFNIPGKGDFYYVFSTYRGNNAFGGKIVDNIKAKADMNGNIIEILN
jgi:hypothetical protein